MFKLGVVMDPIESITVYKDTTLAMLLEVQRRRWSIYDMEQEDLFQRDAESMARMRALRVHDDTKHWFDLG